MPVQEYLIVSSKSVHQTDLQTGKDSAVWPHTRRVTCLSVLSNGTIASGADDGVVRVWDERTPSKPCIEAKDAHASRIRGIDRLGSNDFNLVSGSADGEICWRLP